MTALSPTFSDQQNKLSRMLGDSDTESDALWPLADRQYEINAGELKFATEAKCLMVRTEGTIASQAISLPSGFLGIHMLIVNGVPLTNDHEVPLADWERFVNSGDDKYYFWVDTSGSRQINFHSSASNGLAYILFYFGKPTSVLSADSDESPLQAEWRDGPVFHAAAELLPQAGMTELATNSAYLPR